MKTLLYTLAGIVLGGMLTLLATWSLKVHWKVMDQARTLAKDRPWCLMVPDGDGYRLADHFTDTLGLLMRGDKGHNHAILVVGYRENQKTWHWSYYQFSFLPGSYGPWRSCASYKYDYDHLKPADLRETRELAMGGMVYAIPVVYQPSQYGQYLAWFARQPGFTPTKDACGNRLCNMIGAQPAQDQPLHLPKPLADGNTHAVPLESAGLQPAPFKWNRKHNPIASGLPYGNYYTADDHGNVTTIIECLGPASVQCRMAFIRNGIRYSLHLMPARLAHWKSVQDRLVCRLAGFAHHADPGAAHVLVPICPASLSETNIKKPAQPEA